MLVIGTLDEINEFTLGVTSVILPGTVDIVLRVSQELHPVSNPASHTRNSEKDGEHIGGEAHGSVNEATVEIDVGIELATHAESQY